MKLHEEIKRIHEIMGVNSNVLTEGFGIKPDANGNFCSGEDLEKYNNLVNNVYPQLLKEAIKWWEDWLKSPITKEKFIENNKGTIKNPKSEADKIFEGYLNVLSQIKLVPYGICKNGKPGATQYYMYVTDDKTNNIYVNTGFKDIDNQSLLEVFIHEVQHLLYFHFPLNPSEKVDKCFTVKTFKKGSIFQKLKNLFKRRNKGTEPTVVSGTAINNIATSFSIPVESATKVYNEINKEIQMEKDKGYESYISDHNENLSRITGVRKRLNLVPGDEITVKDFKPFIDELVSTQNPDEYFQKLNEESLNFYWLLLYWGYKGFADFNGLLSSMNQLAYQKNQTNTDNVA